MLYFKLHDGNRFIGASDSTALGKSVQKPWGILMMASDINHAQYVLCNEQWYHDNWMEAETIKGLHPHVTVSEISEAEFKQLSESIEIGEELPPAVEDIDLADDSKEPETEDDVVRRSETIHERLDQLEEQNQMLIECILELTEMLYA